MLGNLFQERVPFERKTGDYLPLKEGWEIVDAYGIEITQRIPITAILVSISSSMHGIMKCFGR